MVVVEVLERGKKSSLILKVELRKYCWKTGSHKEEKESVLGDSKIWPELSERWKNHELIWGDFETKGPRLEFTFENGKFEMQLIFGLRWNLRWKWWRDIECLLKCESNVHGQGQGKRCDLGIQQRLARWWKNPPAMQETQIWSLSQEDPLEEDMTTHFSILAWRILWTEEPGDLQSIRTRLKRLSMQTQWKDGF